MLVQKTKTTFDITPKVATNPGDDGPRQILMPRTNTGGCALEGDPPAPARAAYRSSRNESILGALNGHQRPRRSPPFPVE